MVINNLLVNINKINLMDNAYYTMNQVKKKQKEILLMVSKKVKAKYIIKMGN